MPVHIIFTTLITMAIIVRTHLTRKINKQSRELLFKKKNTYESKPILKEIMFFLKDNKRNL